jgi:Hypothetical protein (DUF2513)
MKRDNDLSRAILLFVQEHCPPEGMLRVPIEIEGYGEATVIGHAELLVEDRYIDGRVTKYLGSELPSLHIIKLTNRGHDAIDATGDEKIWKDVKRTAVEKGVSLTFETAIAMGKRLIAAHLGLPPG